jgi:hypothetical protein
MSDALLREALDNFRIYGDLRRDEVLHGLDGVVNREVASWHRGFIKALDEAQEWWREHAPATPPASAAEVSQLATSDTQPPAGITLPASAERDALLTVARELYSIAVGEHGHGETHSADWPSCLPAHIAFNRYRKLRAAEARDEH